MFSIVIPVFDEAQNIEALVNEIFNSLKDYNDFELIIVNDSSTDNTIDLVCALKKKFNILLINNPKKNGQSFCIHKGVLESRNNTIVTIDGDGQNNPLDIPKLLEIYFSNEKISLVGGIRVKRKDNLIKIISSKIANKIRSNILKDGCEDTGCSLKVFDKSIFLQFPFFNGIHRFLPALFTGYGYKTFFIAVDHRPRIKGCSKYRTLDRLYRGIIDIVKVKRIIKERENKRKNEH